MSILSLCSIHEQIILAPFSLRERMALANISGCVWCCLLLKDANTHPLLLTGLLLPATESEGHNITTKLHVHLPQKNTAMPRPVNNGTV